MESKITKHEEGNGRAYYIAHNVQIGWPDLYEAKPFKNDPKNQPRFGATVFVAKGSPGAEQLKEDIQGLAKSVLKIAKIPESDTFFRDGDAKSDEPPYAGHWYLSLYSYPSNLPGGGKPTVVGLGPKKKDPLPKGHEKAPYSGSVANVIFDAYTSPKWKKVNGGLRTVQVLGDGPPIGMTPTMAGLPDVEGTEDEDDELA